MQPRIRCQRDRRVAGRREELIKHRSRNLIRLVVRRYAQDANAPGDVRFRNSRGLEKLPGGLRDNFPQAHEDEFFTIGIERTLVPVSLHHGQSRNDYRVVQLQHGAFREIVLYDFAGADFIHRQQALV